MIRNEKYKGLWFLPNDRENKVSGVLYFETNKEIRLELIGTFENDIKEILNEKEAEIIYGITDKNEKISLLLCYGYGSVNFPSDFQIATYKCQYFIKGKHLSVINELTFNSIRADLTNLYDWCPAGTIKNTIHFSRDEKPNEIIVSINKNDSWEKIIDVGSDYDLKISGFGGFKSSVDNSEYHIFQKTSLEITHNKSKKSFVDLLNKVGLFKQFLSFATLSNINFNELILFDNSDFFEYKNGEKSLNPISLHFIDDKELLKEKPHYFLFRYNDIENVYPIIIKKWYKSKENLAPIRNHLISSITPKRKFTSLDFLIIVQSLEGYHRRFIFKKDKDLKIRLEELINKFSQVDKINNSPINLTHVVCSRNYYSHFFDKNKNVLDGKELYYLTIQLRNLLICCVLDLIGFDIKLINKLLNNNGKI